MEKQDKKYISTTQLADLLGISRISVFKKIKKGEIKAKKQGRNYIIKKDDVPGLRNELSALDKNMLSKAVTKTVREYGETLKLLAKE